MNAKNKIGLILLSPNRIDGWHWKIPVWAFPLQNNLTLVEIKIIECLFAGCRTVYISVPLKWIPYFKKHYGEFFKFSYSEEPDRSEFSCQVVMLPSVPFHRQPFLNTDMRFYGYMSVRLYYAQRMILSLSRKSLQGSPIQAADFCYVTTDRVIFDFIEEKALLREQTKQFMLLPKNSTSESKFSYLKIYNCEWNVFYNSTVFWFKKLYYLNISQYDEFFSYLENSGVEKYYTENKIKETRYLSVSSIYNDLELQSLARNLSHT